MLDDLDLGPLPAVHPRYVPVELARRELGAAIDAIRTQHALTSAELLWVVASQQEALCQTLLGIERRPARSSEGVTDQANRGPIAATGIRSGSPVCLDPDGRVRPVT